MVNMKISGAQNVNQACSEYVACLYERPFLIGHKSKNQHQIEGRWKGRIFLFITLYFSILLVFNIGIAILDKYIYNSQPYFYASFILGTLIFWPIIIIYNSELFYNTCKNIQCLLDEKFENLNWYKESAERYFCLFPKGEKPAFVAIIINAMCSAMIIVVYVIKVYVPTFFSNIFGEPWLLIEFVAICSLTVFLQKRSRNLLISMFTVCCGLAYYAYISEYSTNKLTPLFVENFVPGTVIIIVLICVLLFIAGSTIFPMLGLFKTFFMSEFEEKIRYPIGELACSLYKIQAIKKYFLHLTGINLLAYFQLLGSVYFFGLLDGDSVITSTLFILGSFFPIVMYLAANVFFKKLCHKIYIMQVKKIDWRINECINEETLKVDEVQALVAVKEMYANEFEIHAVMSKEILVAMLSPIATTIVAVIFPVSNIVGG